MRIVASLTKDRPRREARRVFDAASVDDMADGVAAFIRDNSTAETYEDIWFAVFPDDYPGVRESQCPDTGVS